MDTFSLCHLINVRRGEGRRQTLEGNTEEEEEEEEEKEEQEQKQEEKEQ